MTKFEATAMKLDRVYCDLWIIHSSREIHATIILSPLQPYQNLGTSVDIRSIANKKFQSSLCARQRNLVLLEAHRGLASSPTMNVPTPAQHRALRACMVCSIVQTHTVRDCVCPGTHRRLTRIRRSSASKVVQTARRS